MLQAEHRLSLTEPVLEVMMMMMMLRGVNSPGCGVQQQGFYYCLCCGERNMALQLVVNKWRVNIAIHCVSSVADGPQGVFD